MIVALVALALVAGWSGTAAHASAVPHRVPSEPPSGRADLLAERLETEPVQVTDHMLRVTPPDTANRIKALVARLGVPVYVVVAPRIIAGGTADGGPAEMIPLLYDRLRKDGIYLVTDTRGSGAARQYGGSLPAEDAWRTASLELPFDADVVRHVQRFVEILTAPDVAKRIRERRPRPEDTTPSRGEVRDRKEMAAFGAGIALGGIPLLAVLIVTRLRRTRKAGRR